MGLTPLCKVAAVSGGSNATSKEFPCRGWGWRALQQARERGDRVKVGKKVRHGASTLEQEDPYVALENGTNCCTMVGGGVKPFAEMANGGSGVEWGFVESDDDVQRLVEVMIGASGDERGGGLIRSGGRDEARYVIVVSSTDKRIVVGWPFPLLFPDLIWRPENMRRRPR
ncbi:hypothetical protein BU16DRAFT_59991 [Lophium mytilinum]|uniref:Uncharacterized protein n=1 Tax=Lophium mytilinum TaxID=390894 RepID=A0A6A6QNH3_9PEZI|nr:hypothetical protein BU16DRAFT_59991 [Lophium mytilinum]